jgi:hypothetical protein
MDATVKKIIDQLGKGDPAPSDAVSSLQRSCRMELPQDYLNFLTFFNGAAGTLPNSYHLILWPAETLLDLNEAYQVQEYAPGIFIFGSNGGGEAYGFDTRSSMAVIQVPFVGMALSEAEYLAPSFTAFLIALEQKTDDE